MKVREVVHALELIAPPGLAAEWDNVGLLAGDDGANVGKLFLCIDLTPAVLAEALRAGAGMVMAYHPPIFKPLARVTASACPVVYQAVRRGLALYSMHTALDTAPGGTNDVLAGAMGLDECRPLEPAARQDQCKIVVFVPPQDLSQVAEAAFSAGAGRIGNYYDCAFFSHGVGAFCGSPGTHPAIGRPGRHEVAEEMRLEIVAPRSRAAAVCSAIRQAHRYEEPAIDVYPLNDYPEGIGQGRIGQFARPQRLAALIARVKKATGLRNVLIAAGGARAVTTAACGAGSCGSLFRQALAAGATFYLTGEMRHHDALAASQAGMTVVCLGHSNSERITLPRLAAHLRELLPKLAVTVSRQDRDPLEIA